MKKVIRACFKRKSVIVNIPKFFYHVSPFVSKNDIPDPSDTSTVLWISGFYQYGKLVHMSNKVKHFFNLPDFNNTDYRNQINTEIEEFFLEEEKKMFEKENLKVTDKTPIEVPFTEHGKKVFTFSENVSDSNVKVNKSEENALEFTPRIKISNFIHRYGENGLIIEFSDPSSASKAHSIISNGIGKFIREKHVKSYKVHGKPYFEDIINRSFSSKLTLHFNDVKISKIEEQNIFDLFRPFGSILRLEYNEKTNKVEIQFLNKQNAINARICLHRSDLLNINQTMTIEFLKFNRWRVFFDLLKSPKMIPLMMIIFILVFIVIIDPLRLLNMIRILGEKKRILKSNLKKNEITEVFNDLIKKLKDMINTGLSSENSFVISLTGTKGSGKTTIINESLNNRRMIAIIDCKDKNLKEFVVEVENTLGFRPSFSTLNKTIQYITSIFPAKGVELISSEEIQIRTILQVLKTSCRVVTSVQKKKPIIVFDGLDSLLQSCKKEEKKRVESVIKDVLLWTDKVVERNCASVIITGSFLFHKNYILRSKASPKVTHVKVPKIPKFQALEFLKAATVKVFKEEKMRDMKRKRKTKFRKNDDGMKRIGIFKVLKHYFRSSVEWVGIGDNWKKVEKEVESEVKIFSHQQTSELNLALTLIGTQMSSLKDFLTRYRNCKSVSKSAKMIIQERKDRILQVGFGKSYFSEEKDFGWSKICLFKAISKLSNKNMKYEDILLGVFKGNTSQINKLIQKGILGLEEINGVLYVSPSNKSSKNAFKAIATDKKFKEHMETMESEINLEKEAKRIEKLRPVLEKKGFCNIL